MSLQASFSGIDRHAAWAARPASIFILLGFGVLVGAGAILAPNPAEPDVALVALDPAAITGTFVFSPCRPHDAAIGHAGGDPYGFYVFNREDDLAGERARCSPVLAQAPSAERQGHYPIALENVAQVEPAHVTTNAP
jgi:hypothetical protein